MLLAYSVGAVFGLDEHSGGPMQFSEEDRGSSCEGKAGAHGSDAENGRSNVELMLEIIDLFLSSFRRATAIETDVLVVQAFDMVVKRVHDDLVMSENDNLNIVLQDGSYVLLYGLELCEGGEKVASHECVILSLGFVEHVHQLLTVADIVDGLGIV
jgi:hypothetical protein